jgi:hypothetical protein
MRLFPDVHEIFRFSGYLATSAARRALIQRLLQPGVTFAVHDRRTRRKRSRGHGTDRAFRKPGDQQARSQEARAVNDEDSETLDRSKSSFTSDVYTSVMPEVHQAAAEAVAAIVPRSRSTERANRQGLDRRPGSNRQLGRSDGAGSGRGRPLSRAARLRGSGSA